MVAELYAVGVTLHLDSVLIDEAGCVSEMALPTLICLAPSNLVLIGDPLQLPAYTDLVSPPHNHCRSFMERAVSFGVPAALLSEQYRMHPAICAAVSNEFYAGRLRTPAAVAAARAAVASPCRLVDVWGREHWWDMAGFNNKTGAEAAIRAAGEALVALLGIGVQHPTIYIITLYNRQRDLLKLLLERSREGRRLAAACSCSVLSVDACQGDEVDAVIVSTVRNVFNSNCKSLNLSKFFRDRRRINVAMSRARYMCVVVGNKRTLNVPKAKPWGAVLTGYSKTRA
ncbi:putative ATP-dependent helicase -like [Micractinium conductrix]|uniref:ATP-dependent helicase -like n=1 Tax=Micractinium conductrix TaxID=554055 RepID=A0A2P6VHN8_9CHLO|nr:putative ATP-dependent helicase -like [Micractinium conductrix]|eukprot:PSC73604.1 putative ATP-dependent helicase -like [Micractinium conductrix]